MSQHIPLTYCLKYQLIVILVINTNHQSVSKYLNYIISIYIYIRYHLNFKMKNSLYVTPHFFRKINKVLEK